MMNVLIGFEQANRYVIMDPHGNHIGFLAEREHGIGSTLARQVFRTHRSFTTHVFDKYEREVLRFHRPFSWINSRIRVFDATTGDHSPLSPSTALQGLSAGSIADQSSSRISSLPLSSMRIIGEAQQQWAPLRRKYNLFLHRPFTEGDLQAPQLTSGDLPLSNSTALEPVAQEAEVQGNEPGILTQFAYVNEPFLSWDFTLKSADEHVIGSVNRNFAGFAREILTDTGVYALRMDSESLAAEPSHLISHTARRGLQQSQDRALGMTLDQRAVMLATAVSVDFDYFSRHSGTGGSWFPFFMMGGEATEAGAAGGAATGGAAEAGAVGMRGAGEAATRGAGGMMGPGEGAITGAGTMAGYEAMRRASGRDSSNADDASPWAESGSHEGSSGGAPGGDSSGSGGGGDGGSIFDAFFED